MAIKEKDVKRFSAIALVLILAILAFVIIKPIILSIITGLILSYIFYPIYKITYKIIKERNIAAASVGLIVVIAIFIPLWFLIPLVIKQIFDLFTFFQTINFSEIVRLILPTSSEQLRTDITAAIVTTISKITTIVLSKLTAFLMDLPNLLLNFAVVVFVFFFAMRDADKLKQYVNELSPIKKEKAIVLSKQFKEITNSVIYGTFIIGIIQGIATGIGLFIFGVPRALLLTIFAIVFSMLPVVGPWLVWIPAAFYLFSIGSTWAAIIFVIYCLLVVSTIDNILRPYIVSKKTKSSPVIVLIGMIGGLIVFGVIGLILGPLILEYVILFLDAYKNKTLSDVFEPG